MKPTPRISYLGLGIFFTLLPMVFQFAGGYLVHKQTTALRDYTPTEARVLASDVRIGAGRRGNTFAPMVRYQYTVGDREYESVKVTPFDMSSSRAWAQSIVAHFPAGRPAVAYYDPANPVAVYLWREASFFPYIFILLPTLMTFFGLRLLVGALTRGRKVWQALPVLVWMAVGTAVAVHYFHVAGGRWEKVPAVAFSLYGLATLGLLYLAVRRLRRPALSNQ